MIIVMLLQKNFTVLSQVEGGSPGCRILCPGQPTEKIQIVFGILPSNSCAQNIRIEIRSQLSAIYFLTPASVNYLSPEIDLNIPTTWNCNVSESQCHPEFPVLSRFYSPGSICFTSSYFRGEKRSEKIPGSCFVKNHVSPTSSLYCTEPWIRFLSHWATYNQSRLHVHRQTFLSCSVRNSVWKLEHWRIIRGIKMFGQW